MTNLVVESQRQTRTVRLAVTDADARPVQYGREGAMYRPDTLMLNYVKDGAAPWAADRPAISGPKLKRNGSESPMRSTEHLWKDDDYPAWVTDAIEANHPARVAV